jgi:hypothetical protein
VNIASQEALIVLHDFAIVTCCLLIEDAKQAETIQGVTNYNLEHHDLIRPKHSAVG